MGRFETMNLLWPPAGWDQFGSVRFSTGQALAKDIQKSRIYGLQYKIDSVPIFKNETKLYRHDVVIDGWEYSISNESIEYPVLSFSLLDRFMPDLPRECFIADIRTYDTRVAHTRRSAMRCVNAGVFLLKQIENGHVPDADQILKMYKIHPQQANLYQNEPTLEAELKQVFADVQTESTASSSK